MRETHQSSRAMTVGVIKENVPVLHLTNTPNNGRKGLQVFRRWATHKLLQARFIRLALRLGWGVNFLFLLLSWAVTNLFVCQQHKWLKTCEPQITTIIQYSIIPRMDVVQTQHWNVTEMPSTHYWWWPEMMPVTVCLQQWTQWFVKSPLTQRTSFPYGWGSLAPMLICSHCF